MDRMIASTCFDSKRERLLNGHDDFVPAIDTQNNNNYNHVVFSSVFAKNKNNNVNGGGIDGGEGCSKMVVRECRICQEEDEENEMEAPCACNGTLKFAHRKCIQRWCNKKGDITCEICNQVYSPNYILPPARSNPDVMAIDIRQAWGPQIDFRDGHFLTFAAAERQFLQPEYEDYAAAHSGSIACLRAVAILLMLILLVRQAMLVTRDFGMLPETSSSFFNFQVSLLQLAGLLLPCYVVTRSWLLILRQRRRQG